MKVSDVLTDESKWIKGHSSSPDGRFCLGYAIQQATEGNARNFINVLYTVSQVIYALFPERITGRTSTIVSFNDHPDTTFEDVQRVMKFANV